MNFPEISEFVFKLISGSACRSFVTKRLHLNEFLSVASTVDKEIFSSVNRRELSCCLNSLLAAALPLMNKSSGVNQSKIV